MTNKLAKMGFTLIELLVVVLIIGILAGVALPQYNKAVRRARLSEVATTFNAFSKGVDAWLLENDGYPSSGVVNFVGTNKTANLDIDISCASQDNATCYTKVGKWYVTCQPVSNSYCDIALHTEYYANKATGNEWLGKIPLYWSKHQDGSWSLQVGDNSVFNNSPFKGEICRWWKDMYGNERVVNPYGVVSDACSAY